MKIAGFTLHFFFHTNFTFQCTLLSKTFCAFMVSHRRHYMYKISSQKCTKNNIILVSTHAHIISSIRTPTSLYFLSFLSKSLQSLLNKLCMHKVMRKTHMCTLINSMCMHSSLNFCTRMRIHFNHRSLISDRS